MAIVYLATNRINGKRYIGVSSKRLRWRRAQHEHEALKGKAGCRKFHAAIKKYGPEAFDWQEIFRADCYEAVLAEEIRLIALLTPEYNIALGGRTNKGFSHSVAFKAKKSEVMSGRKLSAEHRRKIGQAGRGRIFSDETRKKISDALKGRQFSPAHRAALSAAKAKLIGAP